MKKTLIALLILSLNTHASTDINVKVPLQFDDETYLETPSLENTYLKIILHNLNFPYGKQYEKLKKAISILPEVINSEEFKRKILTYKQPNGLKSFANNYLWTDSSKRLSNEEIYQILMRGHEKTIPRTLQEMNLNIDKYFVDNYVIGYTIPSSSKWINVNWKYYSYFQVDQMVNNIVHEWIHLLGFLHGENPGQEVTYVAGKIAGNIARKLLK